ncbi:hypothetical protein WH50_09745 [Pokkaliibacter plantistimulans]|uniref:Uncharacterized protein n=1 Tax=Pokkaliibacter plantistimulans TaxID=1635171 RepID=A0ABX5LZ91_9GAMM|nr:hypothetical protein [Pokkaliibacter plantistimulans]PXF31469.1 hypothetical protein WH50_09745 [Pokkaliibacter plantistimulans]
MTLPPLLQRQTSLPSAPAETVRLSAPQAQDDNVSSRLHLDGRVGRLKRALEQEVERHGHYDQALSLEWSEGASVAKRRRLNLGQLPGAEQIAAQYGLSFASREPAPAGSLPQLTLDHGGNAQYLRSHLPEELKAQCQQAFHARYGQPAPTAVYVNGPHTALAVLQGIGESNLKQAPVAYLKQHLLPVHPGLFALRLRPRDVAVAEQLLGTYGAVPSAYAVVAAASGPARSVVANPHLDNQQLLSQLRDSGVCQRLQQLPAGHSLAALGKAAAAQIEALCTVVDERQLAVAHRHNPVLANGLQHLQRAADSLPSLSHDSQLFGNGYELLQEELQVCLSALQPYTLDDFKQAARPMLGAAGLPAGVVAEVHLLSSGMQAIATSLRLAEKMTGINAVEEAVSEQAGITPVYFEVESLHTDMDLESSDGNAVLATLNHSMPPAAGEKHWGVDSVIDAVRGRLAANAEAGETAPLILILDSTLERRGDMDKLVGQMADALSSGSLRMLVCKSFQKYANLCSGKAMAGAIGLISRDDVLGHQTRGYLRQVEQGMQRMASNDSQLLVNMLHCRDSEFELLERATGNARFVAQTLLRPRRGQNGLLQHDASLPFVVVSSDRPALTLQLGTAATAEIRLPCKDYFSPELLPQRSSFAFSHTSMGVIPGDDEAGEADRYRFSLGQESHAELAERFFMPGLLLQKACTSWSYLHTHQLVQQLTDMAVSLASGRPAAAGRQPAMAMPLLQKLQLCARLERPPVEDRARLQDEPGALRQQQQQDRPRPFFLNKIVSAVNFMGEAMLHHSRPEDWQQPGPARQAVDHLLASLLQSGMPGVSRAGRAKVIEQQAFLCQADMGSPDTEQQQRGLRTLAASCARIPALPSRSRYLLSIPDTVFAQASRTDQRRVLEALLTPLDTASQLAAIDKLLQGQQWQLATACLEQLERQPSAPTGKAATPDGSSTPAMQATTLRSRLQEQLLQQRLQAPAAIDAERAAPAAQNTAEPRQAVTAEHNESR